MCNDVYQYRLFKKLVREWFQNIIRIVGQNGVYLTHDLYPSATDNRCIIIILIIITLQ